MQPKPVPLHNQAPCGEMKWIILDAMKRAKGEPLNSREITDLVMQQRGLGMNNLRLRVAMNKRVCAALTSMRRRGLLVSDKEGKGLQMWRSTVAGRPEAPGRSAIAC